MPAKFEVSLVTLPTLVKVNKRGCWEWQRSTRGRGYAQMTNSFTRIQDYGHRVVWELYHKRRIPKGKLVLHICDNRICVNPEHLKLGTYAVNNKETWSRHPEKEKRRTARRTCVTKGKLKKHFKRGREIGMPRGLLVMNGKV